MIAEFVSGVANPFCSQVITFSSHPFMIKPMTTKSFYLSIFLLAVISICAPAQQLKRNAYRIRVQLSDGNMFRGYLYALHDSSIQVFQYARKNLDTLFSFRVISSISLRRRNAPGNGFLAGLGVGGGLGALLGFMTHTPPDCGGGFCMDFGPGLSAIAGGAIGGLFGGLLGMQVGSRYKSFPIHGDFAMFNAVRATLLSGPRRTIQKMSVEKPVASRIKIPQTGH